MGAELQQVSLATPLGLRALSRLFRARVMGGLLACLLACTSSQVRAQTASSDQPAVSLEYAVKATYLYKLAPFVNWPPTTFTAPDAPLRICVVGDDPFDDYLDRAVAGRRFGTHPFQVRRLDAAPAAADCQIVFVSHLSSQDVAQALHALDGKPVLTVVDSTATAQGGIVQFVMDHGRVRFDIDVAAAARNHLTINSKLLSLALAVRGAS